MERSATPGDRASRSSPPRRGGGSTTPIARLPPPLRAGDLFDAICAHELRFAPPVATILRPVGAGLITSPFQGPSSYHRLCRRPCAPYNPLAAAGDPVLLIRASFARHRTMFNIITQFSVFLVNKPGILSRPVLFPFVFKIVRTAAPPRRAVRTRLCSITLERVAASRRGERSGGRVCL